MDALILAAGSGSRLGAGSPKCLARIGGRPLLHIQLDTLRRAGIENVTVVVGYRHGEVQAAAFGDVGFVYNGRFAETNSLYSFLLARSAVMGSDLVVLNADVLFPLEMLGRVLDADGSAVAFDSTSGADDEHMKVCLRAGRLVSMSKQLPAEFTAGENVGLLRLDVEAAEAAFDAAEAIVGRGHLRHWLAAALNGIAATHRIAAVDAAGLPWVEIDYPDDLVRARSRVWPAIESLDPLTQRARVVGPLWSASVIDSAVAW